MPSPELSINDISTDVTDVPSYSKAQVGPLPEDFKPIISGHYTAVKPLISGKPPAEVFKAASVLAANQTRWKISYEDQAAGVLEGVATTLLLRFKDDWVVRIRPEGAGSRVDMRSKSRVGSGDLGANAKRITKFLSSLEKTL